MSARQQIVGVFVGLCMWVALAVLVILDGAR